MHILICDDEPMVRAAMERVLQQAGHTTCWSGTGRGALALLASEEPDLLLLDMVLPDVSGWEVRRLQLLDERIAHVPVIVCSGLSPDEVRRLGSVQPMALVQLIMTKPLDLEQLLRNIAHIEGITQERPK